MGSFIHYCENCRAKLNVDNAWIGKSLDCPACGKKIFFEDKNASDTEKPTVELKTPDFMTSSMLEPPDPPTQSAPKAPAAGNAPRRIMMKPINPAGNSADGKAADTSADIQMPEPPTSANIPEPPVPPPLSAPKSPAAGNAPRKIMMKPINPAGNNDTVSTTADNAAASQMPKPPVPPTAQTETKAVETDPASSNTSIIPPAAVDQNHTTTVKYDKTPAEEEKKFFHRYFFGRLGVASVIVLAIIALLAGIYFSWHVYQDYSMKVDLIPEKHQLKLVNKELNERENSLSSQFKNAILLLQGTGKIIAGGMLNGLPLSDDVCRRPDPMPLGLLSDKEMAEAKRILEQYKNSNKKIKEEFIKAFGNLLMLQNTSVGGKKVTSSQSFAPIVVQAGEIKKKFYIDEKSKKQQLQSLDTTVQKIKNQIANASSDQQTQLQQLAGAVEFVRRSLFPNDSNLTVVKSSSSGNKSIVSNKNTPEKNDLVIAAQLVAELSNGWMLDTEIAGMENLLDKVTALQQMYAKKKSLLMREMVKEQVKIYLTALLAAFALLVAGDVLKAHFDSAENLKRLTERK